MKIKDIILEGNFNSEDYKPYIVKDTNNPNFLKVYIKYPTGSGNLTALGQRTMSGQDRDSGSAKAMKIGQAVAAKLEAKYNLEDIEVTDSGNGNVVVFAVSDDFINMKTTTSDISAPLNEISDAKKLLNSIFKKYNIAPASYQSSSVRGFGKTSGGYKYERKGMVMFYGVDKETVQKIAADAKAIGVQLGMVYPNGFDFNEN